MAKNMCLPILVFLLMIFAAQAQNVSVIITNIDTNVVSGDPLIEHVDAHPVTAEITIGTTTRSDPLTGSNLWKLTFYIADSSQTAVPGTEVNATLTNPNVGVTPGRTFTLEGTATLNLGSRNCSQLPIFCATVSANPSASPAFTLTPDTGYSTRKCTDISCKGRHVSDVVITNVLPAQTEDRSLIQGIDNIGVNLTVTLLSSYSGSLLGTGLWQAYAFLNSEVNGTGTRLLYAAVNMLDSADYGISNGSSVWPKIQTDFDLTNVSCTDFDYVCVEVQKGNNSVPAFTLSFLPSTADVGCAQIQCTGIQILSGATLTIIAGFLEGRSTTVEFDISYPTGNAGVTGSNLWEVYVYASANADGSGARVSYEQVPLSTADAGMAIESIGDSLSFTGLSVTMDFSGQYCADGNITYLCAVLTKSSSAMPDFKISPESNTVCQPAPCAGVVIDGGSQFLDSDNSIKEHSSTNVTFGFEIDSSASSAVLNGTDLWRFNVFVSAFNNGSGERYGETFASLSDEQKNTAITTAGSTLVFTDIAASLDLADLKCFDDPNTFYYLCVEFMRDPESNPTFSMTTVSGNPLTPSCAVTNCRGVRITGASVSTSNVDPVVERSNNTITFSTTISSDADWASISGNNLWKLTADLKDRYGNKFTPDENVVILVSEASKDITAGTDIQLSDLKVTVDLTDFICPAIVQLCVVLEKNDAANPDFTFDPNAGVFPSCVYIDCEGVVITNSSLTESSDITFKEGSINQVVDFDLHFMVAEDAGGIDGDDQWVIEVFVNSESDGTGVMYSEVYGVLPQNVANIPANPGENMDFNSVSATLDFSSPMYLPCGDIFYLCATLKKADTASKNFTLSGRPTDALLTACESMACEGVIIENTELTLTTDTPFVKEGSTETLTFDISLTPDINSSTLTTGLSLWSVKAFGSSMSDGFGDRSAVVAVDTTGVGAVGVTPGWNTNLTSLSVNFNLSSISCESFSYMCVEVSRNDAAYPHFSLQGSPTGDALVGCAEIKCIDTCLNNTCLNGGKCLDINGTLGCNCPLFYSGDLCEDVPGPAKFSVKPILLKADLHDAVNLTCNVSDSNDWQWYKDNVPLSYTNNKYLITVTATIENQGYYSCSGFGAGPHTNTLFESNKVLLVINDILIFPASLTFNRGFHEDLSDPSSTAFKNESSDITDFFNSSLSLNDEILIQVRSFYPGSIIAYVNFYVLNTSSSYDDFLEILTQEVIRIGENSDGYLVPDSIVISSTEMCYKENYDGHIFPDASVGETVDSEDLCDKNKVHYLLPRATRTCDGDGFSAAKWDTPVMADCGNDVTTEQQLERLNMVNVTTDNVEDVSNDLQEITSNAQEITVEALEYIAEILTDILQTNSNSSEVTDSLVMVVENLFSVDENILLQSQMENQAPTRIVEVLEGQLSIVELNDEGIYEEMAPNLAVHVQMFDVSQFSVEDISYLSYFSESVGDRVGNIEVLEDRGEIPDAANVSIALPVSISDIVKRNNMTDFRIVVVVYSGSRLFQSSPFESESLIRRPNSQVISLSVPGLDRVELQEPVVTTFIPLKINESIINTTCVFWDFELDGVGGWSSEGCMLVNESVDGSHRQYCECTHLTNFAILMDFKKDGVLPPPAEILTKVGLSISIVCLCLTVLTLVTNKKFRQSEPRKLQCQLCVSLLGLYIVFLAGIDRTNRSEVCIVAGAFVHYFLLSSVFWMSVQAINMYYLFVKVFDTHVQHFFLKACLFAWGLPVVIVLVSAFIDIDSYIDSKTHCFLTLERMYYAVAIPVALPLLFNMLIFIMVIHSLSQRGEKTNESPLKKMKNRSNGMKMLQNGVSITLVLGLTWIVGFFAIGDAAVIMLWLFCILNSFQGFLIFIMYCVRNKDVRTHWCKMLRISPKNT